ncbi:BON domain-containing protein [Variovorax sp. dw_308]|uniref:BON domain-containing protein n=1 Tax=Variovorax sp. dw_308 TaxID=2721546 RepID=UPI001C4438D8|nr:BON domain-containing protein [Variovorax sp. dw_308]
MTSKSILPLPLAALLLASALSLTACDHRPVTDNRPVSGPDRAQVDAAIDKTRDATVAVANKAADLAEKARDQTVAFAKSPQVREDASKVVDAMKNVGTVASAKVDDAAITASVSAGLARDTELSARQINVETRAGAVKLVGPAPSAQAKARASDIARSVSGVASVDNQLEVRSM